LNLAGVVTFTGRAKRTLVDGPQRCVGLFKADLIIGAAQAYDGERRKNRKYAYYNRQLQQRETCGASPFVISAVAHA
jgi:hypothetical protein